MTTQGTPTPPKVIELATQQAQLPRTALLGVFGPTAAPRALIRTPQGATQTVDVGDTIAGATVAAISDGMLVLKRKGSEKILRLPND